MRHDTHGLVMWIRLLSLAAVLVVAGGMTYAGWCCGEEECTWIVVDPQRIIEDPDPILRWQGYTENLGYPLNPGGDDRGDGPLDGVLDPFTGVPSATWAFNAGSYFDIAFTQWTSEGWAPVEFLTANAWDDLDPQVAVGDDGTMYVVWWHSEGPASDIRMSTRAPYTGSFGIPSVIAENGSRPSVVVVEDTLIVAFERPTAGGGHEIVLLQQQRGGDPRECVFASVARDDSLQVRVIEERGFAWMHWVYSESLAGYTEYKDGEWGAPPEVPVGGDHEPRDYADVEMNQDF